MQTRRLIAPLAVGLVALAGVAGCRTSPNVAAYVGDEQVSVTELQSAVDERLADPAIAEAMGDGGTDFTRQVLTLLVRQELYAETARRNDVEVTEDDVSGYIDTALAGRDEAEVYAQAAAQGYSREDVRDSVRQQLLRRELGAAAGTDPGTDEAALRARYEEVRAGLEQVELGYFAVPDQATADDVVAQLTEDPATYPEVAARYPSEITQPELQPTATAEVPAPLAEGVAAAAPGTGFTITAGDVPGVVVAFVGARTTPPFEEVRPQLEDEAAQGAEEAGVAVVDAVRDDVGVTVNPRYGEFTEDAVQEAEGGVVALLGDDTTGGTTGTGTGTGDAADPAGN